MWFLYCSLLLITILLCAMDYIKGNKTKWMYGICFILNIYEFLSVKGFTYTDPFSSFFDYPLSFWVGYYWASIVSVILSAIFAFKKSIQHEEKPVSTDNYSNMDLTVSELMTKSNLSKEICTDIYKILTDFKLSRKDDAFNKIHNELIPNLKQDGKMGIVGIAFGMLIDEIALTKEEANYYSTKVIEEMINTKDKML